MIKNALWLFICTSVALFAFLPSYTRVQDLKEINETYQAQIEELKLTNAHLKRERDLLENDPEYLEKIAREKMGVVKEGEVVVKFENND